MAIFKSTKPTSNAALAARFADICEHMMEQGGNFSIHHNDMSRDVNSMGYTVATNGSNASQHFHTYGMAYSYNEPEVYFVLNRGNKQWEIWFNEDSTSTNTTSRHLSLYRRAMARLVEKYDIPVYLVHLGSWSPNHEFDRVGHSNVHNAAYVVSGAMHKFYCLSGKFIRTSTIERELHENTAKLHRIARKLREGIDVRRLESTHVAEKREEVLRDIDNTLSLYNTLGTHLDTDGLQAAKRYVQAVEALEA